MNTSFPLFICYKQIESDSVAWASDMEMLYHEFLLYYMKQNGVIKYFLLLFDNMFQLLIY